MGLEDRGFAPFLDRHDIEPGEPWEARLGGLIEQSDTVVFVVSPEAVKSERCDWEINKTLALSKRLLPVIHKSVPDVEIPPKLSELQFVRFDTAPGVMRPLRELADALRVDLDWIREHTRLGELADALGQAGTSRIAAFARRRNRRREDMDGRPQRGSARDHRRAARLHQASEEAEAARLGKERAQLEAIRMAQEATARQQRRAARLLWSVAALVLAMVGYVTWQSYDLARREINVFTARATEALNDEQFDRAMRYALQAYPARGRPPLDHAVLNRTRRQAGRRRAVHAAAPPAQGTFGAGHKRGVQRRRQAGGDGVWRQHCAHLGCGERQGDRRPQRP